MWYLLPSWTSVVTDKRLIDVFLSCLFVLFFGLLRLVAIPRLEFQSWWNFEKAIPLFVTLMFVPLLLVLLRVIRDENGVAMTAPAATKYVTFLTSQRIILNTSRVQICLFYHVLSNHNVTRGFTISLALSKTNIDWVIITRVLSFVVLSFAGTRLSRVLLAFMGVSCFASMWIRWRVSVLAVPSSEFLLWWWYFSNVATTTLCFTLIRVSLSRSSLRPPVDSTSTANPTLPSSESVFAPCLIVSGSFELRDD